MKFTQVWKLMWGVENDLKDWTAKGVPFITAERLDANLTAAYERGVKDASKAGGKGQRQGVADLGQAIRKNLNDYRTGAMVPAWVIENILSDWNVPEAPA